MKGAFMFYFHTMPTLQDFVLALAIFLVSVGGVFLWEKLEKKKKSPHLEPTTATKSQTKTQENTEAAIADESQ